MRGMTHMVAGACAGAALAAHADSAPQRILLIGAGALGGLFPDIDTATSKLGRKLAPASFLIQHIIGHRTLFHAPLPYIALYFLGISILPAWSQLYMIAALLGIASHLLLDMLNPSGIPLLWPWRKRFHLAPFSVGGI